MAADDAAATAEPQIANRRPKVREAGQARTILNKEGIEVQRRELNKSHDASSRRVDEQVTAAS